MISLNSKIRELDSSFKEINTEDYIDFFNQYWKKINSCFIKTETRQDYFEPKSKSYQAFLNGDMAEAELLIKDRVKKDEAYLKIIPESNVDYSRIRLIRTPLSSYTRYELMTYKVSALYGQRIFLIDEAKATNLGLTLSFDIMLFDNFGQINLLYDDKGALYKIFYSEDEKVIKKSKSTIQKVIKNSKSLGQYINI